MREKNKRTTFHRLLVAWVVASFLSFWCFVSGYAWVSVVDFVHRFASRYVLCCCPSLFFVLFDSFLSLVALSLSLSL